MERGGLMHFGRSVTALAALVALSSFLLAGCGDDSTGPAGSGQPTQDNPSLNDPLGGYTNQTESPAFGDADLAGSSEAEVVVEDAIASDPDFVRWIDADSVHTYAVTLMWGILDHDISIHAQTDGDSLPGTDWSGYLQVSRGGVLVRATIGFEPNDYLVGPRIERDKVMWVSHTGNDLDGIRLLVIQPLGRGQDGANDSLVIVAGTHRWDLRINDLADLDRTDVVDDLGNKISIRSFLVVPQACNRGFMGGGWFAPRNPGEDGRFQGRWVTANGELNGFVRGIWGINDKDQKVFFGKYIDRDGRVLGILRGTWDERGPDGPAQSNGLRAHGMLRGEWVDGDGAVRGSIRGHWRSSRGGADGFFDGGWAERGCMNP